jgi:hypothetical protein
VPFGSAILAKQYEENARRCLSKRPIWKVVLEAAHPSGASYRSTGQQWFCRQSQ